MVITNFAFGTPKFCIWNIQIMHLKYPIFAQNP